MTRMDENDKSARLVRWYVADGAPVHRDQPICEIEASVASVEVPAPSSGILHQLAKVGDVIRTDSDVARIEPTK